MNKYNDKSDFEINKAVAIARGAKPFHDDGFKKSTGYFHKDAVIIKAKFKIGAFDPCNNPADAMPIVIDNKISLYAPRLNEDWMAEYAGSTEDVNDGFQVDYFDAHNQNPLRAAMEVFLMMKDAENEKS
ncbi:recombinase [Morganella morganii]|uniref:phage protein NinX family protein n=1 Tax=Morganella morganii TaxID=582 RepID=UPI000BC60D27|nr:phage protein NinX family protein [Morganella morganii]PCP73070.1 recombinase [Morganella morganii]